jgi:hypothetical protein
MSTLAEFQDAFSQALLADAAASSGLFSQPGFAVYRNTVLKGCIDALRANFPAVARLVGDTWFGNAAAVYVRAASPSDPRLLFYGEGFPDFLAHFPPAAEQPYLSGVARLDRLWIESHAAADDEALDSSGLFTLAPEALGRTVVRPRTSVRWRWFADMPVYSIWSANREDRPGCAPTWQGEGALLVRNGGHVESMEAGTALCTFLDICGAGRPLADAAQAAIEADADASVATLMSTLLSAGALRAMPYET